MTTLSELTMKQLVTAYISLTGIEVGPKFFNSRATGIRRIQALLAETSRTEADALRAAGIPFADRLWASDPARAGEIAAAAYDGGSYGGTPADRGIAAAILEDRERQAACAQESEIPESEDDNDAWEPETTPAPEPASEATDPAAILASPQVSADIQALVFKHLTGAGLSEEEAGAAARRVGNALIPTTSATRVPKAARPGSKQDQVIALLRRPEGATIAQISEATGWLPHTCRGALAGALKKRLGLTVTSSKEAGGQRVYQLATE